MSSSLLTLLRKVDDALGAHVGTAVFGLADGELVEAMTLAHRLVSGGSEIELRLAHQAASRDVDVKTVWVRKTQQTPQVAAARLRLAAAVERREPLRAAMAAGCVSEPQARVVVTALDELPADLDAEVLVQAQDRMIALCASHHPDELRKLGRKLLEVLAPERAEEHEAKRVDAEHRRAVEKCRLSMWDRGDGTFEGRFAIPAMHGQIFKKLLLAWSSPKYLRATEGAGVERMPSPQRLGLAFCGMLEKYPHDQMPHTGGVSARVVVDINLDDLSEEFTKAGVATLDGEVDIPAWVARRLACEAGIVPVVLGGKGQVLDLGRSRRLHTEAQRIVIFKRDKTCRAEGCDWPAWMGHVHHPIPWSRGGNTDLTGMALCPHHHTRAHDPTYEMTISKNGKVVFRRT